MLPLFAVGLAWVLAGPPANSQLGRDPLAPSSVSPPTADQVSTPGSALGRPPVDVNANEPPPSTYDREQGRTGTEDGGRSLLGQMWRTLLSLALVVGLIYAVGKFALWRLGKARGPGGPGLKVVERLQLDARHALFVVEVSGKHRYLVGAGADKGVTLLAELDDTAADSERSFSGVLARGGVEPPIGNEGSS